MALRVPIFSIEANPTIDKPFLRKSITYCETEVQAGRARRLDDNDIRVGIQLVPINRKPQAEVRGSRERFNCLTADESHLNAECARLYRQHDEYTKAIAEGRACLLGYVDIPHLIQRYETKLEKYLIDPRRKGTPRQCEAIAARVKTILSQPVYV